eukprot:11193278-Heterocapsa_arctica.AAC.1
MHDLMHLPLHQVLLDRGVVGLPHRKVPWAVGIRHQAAFHPDHPWVRASVGGRVIRDRGH